MGSWIQASNFMPCVVNGLIRGEIEKPRSTICQWFDLKTTGTIFSSLTSKHVATVYHWFDLKTIGTVSSGLTSKPVATIFWLSLKTKVVQGCWVVSQNRQVWFGDLGLKITATISLFVSQNQSDFGLSVASQN
jgi:hypothetical protein